MIKPLPHQLDAIKAVLAEFKTASRTQIQMACGTGKTVTTLWIAEKLKPKSILVLLPSLALVNQFMKEWLKNTKFVDYKTMVVCGDNTVTDGLEDESLLLENIDFPVTQDALEIKAFMIGKGLKIVFSTYHSSWLLEGLRFDLAVFDEAHKTAGVGKELWSFCLHDNNVKIDKRLFITATPRHTNINAQNEVPVYSMDDEAVYGRRCYELGFRAAINLGLICDYEVIITTADINKHEFKGVYETQEKGIALWDAVMKTGAKKIVTYHSNINAAQAYAKYLKVSNLLNGYKISHVNGALNIETRQCEMNRFKDSTHAVITNSKCLTEGVDVPAIDMVAFLNPKSSKIDIVQAIGRALRKAPGKTVGYICLPLFLDKDIPDEQEALEQSEFKHIWEVLNAISEQDCDLNDVIKAIKNGNGTNEHFALWDEKVQIFMRGREFSKLKELITSKIIDRLGRRWDQEELLEEMVAFVKANGHCHVKRKENPRLYRWLHHVKEKHKTGMANIQIVNKLKELGFNFDKMRKSPILKWDENYIKLCKIAKNLPKPFSISRIGDHAELGRWCIDIRGAYRDGKLTQEQIALLNKIGFDWDPNETEWHIKYEQVKNLIATQQTFDGSNKNWIDHQRDMFRKNKLSEYRIELLDKIGITLERMKNKRFSFADHPINNHPLFLTLMAYYKKHKTWVIPQKNAELTVFIKNIRQRYRQKILNPQSIALLNKYKFVWEPESQAGKKQIAGD